MKKICLLCFLFFCCSQNLPVESRYDDQIVVEGYIYAHHPVRDIWVKSLGILVEEYNSDVGQPITSAVIELHKKGIIYHLTASEDSGRYIYTGQDLRVEPSDTFTLTVDYNGIHCTSCTVVPLEPEITSISLDTIIYAKDYPLPSKASYDSLWTTIQWTSNDESYFITMLKNNFNGDLYSSMLDYRPAPPGYLKYEYTLGSKRFPNAGQYIFYVYNVTNDYWNYYSARHHGDAKNPQRINNMINGYGLFSAASYDSVFVYAQESK
ncbi:DUF4249 family protein [candidate division KSB1 bacterium]|nr:DUF4249 family protein [candidate division KSB1 bacterium]